MSNKCARVAVAVAVAVAVPVAVDVESYRLARNNLNDSSIANLCTATSSECSSINLAICWSLRPSLILSALGHLLHLSDASKRVKKESGIELLLLQSLLELVEASATG